MTAKEYIYVHVEAEKCTVVVLCNGLPVITNTFNGKNVYSCPINAYLIKENQTQITVLPIEPEDLLTQNPEVKVTIKSYNQDTYSVSPETGRIIAQTELTGYSVKNLSFTNNILNFASTFLKLPVIETEEEIMHFAKQLELLFVKQNENELQRIFQPKLDDYALAYYEEKHQYSESFRRFLIYEFFPLGLLQESAPIILTSFLDKKIWRIATAPNFEFIRSKPDKENSCFTIEIYVAKVGDEIMVIR